MSVSGARMHSQKVIGVKFSQKAQKFLSGIYVARVETVEVRNIANVSISVTENRRGKCTKDKVKNEKGP